MGIRVWQSRLLVLFLTNICGRLTCWAEPMSAGSSVCPVPCAIDSIIQPSHIHHVCTNFDDFLLHAQSHGKLLHVAEGGEVSLQRALSLVHVNSQKYVAVLFYASWCPFSRTCRTTFTVLSSLYPSISHFAVEESAVRPSTLSKYRVHGFPTLFLINSTTRVRYHGSRTINSLATFYTDITGMKPVSLDQVSSDDIRNPPNLMKLKDTEEESCPYSWVRFPETLLQQESYLALATTFVVLRLFHILLPNLLVSVHCAWRRHIQKASLLKLWEHFKKYNLQEGALNARGWASKSLASVSIGDASSSWGVSGRERH